MRVKGDARAVVAGEREQRTESQRTRGSAICLIRMTGTTAAVTYAPKGSAHGEGRSDCHSSAASAEPSGATVACGISSVIRCLQRSRWRMSTIGSASCVKTHVPVNTRTRRNSIATSIGIRLGIGSALLAGAALPMVEAPSQSTHTTGMPPW